MRKIAWITDSTSGLSKDFIEKHNIFVLPMNVIVNDISYREDIDITKDEFYEKLKVHGLGAKTSQPTFGEFVELYEKLKTEYDCGIALHASSELTGTYQSSQSASEMANFPVEVIDSRIGAYPLGKMIDLGIELEQKGQEYEEIVETLRTLPEKAQLYLFPENLEQLRRSGRVSAARSALASIMNIKLMLCFDNGKVVIHDKVRTSKRVRKKMNQIIEEAIEKHKLNELCILHAGVFDQAQQWKLELEKLHAHIKFKIETLVPVAGVHTGYGTLGIAWLAK
ncbi:DegV family protein [Radiobacillus kanasensis]|uniref:DegV family protein n=1 Tax=Radiobacillus kanasensis TaxID=2844358 RepID=UPI001E4D6B26|nr:DegV family protein [Radiobacillus kanasensis]UFU00435.1 DegV family protein [Radiobacillus kanasensis]